MNNLKESVIFGIAFLHTDDVSDLDQSLCQDITGFGRVYIHGVALAGSIIITDESHLMEFLQSFGLDTEVLPILIEKPTLRLPRILVYEDQEIDGVSFLQGSVSGVHTFYFVLHLFIDYPLKDHPEKDVPYQDYPPMNYAYSENGIIKYCLAYSVNRRT